MDRLQRWYGLNQSPHAIQLAASIAAFSDPGQSEGQLAKAPFSSALPAGLFPETIN